MRQPPAPVSPDRLRLYANPFRLLFSASPWLAASYLLSYIILSGVLFAVALTVTVATAVLAVTVALVPLLIASAAVVRGCAEVERARLLLVFRQPVRGSYPAAGPGLWRRARRAWSSGATWRDMAYLLGLWVPLFALAVAAIATWLWALAGITLPLWYRFVSDICFGTCANDSVHGVLIGSFPNGPHGVGADGLWIYPSVGPALLVAAGSAVVFLALTYVLVAVARVHGNVARAVLRGASDPLEPARAVLAESGPLGTLVRPPDL